MDIDITDDEARERITAMMATAPRPALLWALMTLPSVLDMMRPIADAMPDAGESEGQSTWMYTLDEAYPGANAPRDDGRDTLYVNAIVRGEPFVFRIMQDAAVNAAICMDMKRADDMKRAGRSYDPNEQLPPPPWNPDDPPPGALD